MRSPSHEPAGGRRRRNDGKGGGGQVLLLHEKKARWGRRRRFLSLNTAAAAVAYSKHAYTYTYCTTYSVTLDVRTSLHGTSHNIKKKADCAYVKLNYKVDVDCCISLRMRQVLADVCVIDHLSELQFLNAVLQR
jgi:hypothetical protein